MPKVKKVMYILGGVALLILGVLLGCLSNRRRVPGTIGQPGNVGSDIDGAIDANSLTSGAVGDSASLNQSIEQTNTTATKLLHRSREILEKAKARSGDSSG